MASAQYRRRQPKESVLHQAVQRHLLSFVEHAQSCGKNIPGFVMRRFQQFLDCGDLSRGFARFVCHSCKQDHLVAFSCKVRGLCSSCGAKRMAASAAHLVDYVFPRAPVRQWVLSLPIRLRYILAYDAELCSQVLAIYVREIYRAYRWTAKAELGLDTVRDAHCGSVTYIQRADSGLRLNLHFHALVIDGIFLRQDDWLAKPTFHALPPPSDEQIAHVAIAVRCKVLCLLEEAGHTLGDADAFETFDDFSEREPVLAACAAASTAGTVAVFVRAALPGERWRDPMQAPVLTSTRCVNADGFSLHANTHVGANDRKGLEKLCRYAARPPIAMKRLRWLEGGKIAYDLKRVWSDGSLAVVFEPLDFIAKLLPLMPPIRVNQIRFHGVLAPAASMRNQIVPEAPQARRDKRPTNYCWAELMARVFEFDVLKCPKCSGPMRLVATITDRETIQARLAASGLPADSPTLAPAQSPLPDSSDDWEAA